MSRAKTRQHASERNRRGSKVIVLFGLVGVAVMSFALPREGRTAEEDRPILHQYFVYSSTTTSEVCVIDYDGTDRRCITDNRRFETEAVWSPDSARIAFVQQRNDPRNPDIYVMDADGEHKRRLTWSRRDDEAPDWSPDGTQIVWSRNRGTSPTSRLFVMGADGNDKRLLVGGGDDLDGEWSPAGGEIVFLSRDECLDDHCAHYQLDVHVIDADGSEERNLTNSPPDELDAVWSPDGSRIAFVRAIADDDHEIFVMDRDGSDVTQLTDIAGASFLPAWSPDGSQIAFTAVTVPENFNTRLGVVDVNDGGTRLLTSEEIGGVQPVWAPSGSYIAFTGNRSLGHRGSYEIHTIRPDGSDLRRLTRTAGEESQLDWSGW